jgi:hypothetical protein
MKAALPRRIFWMQRRRIEATLPYTRLLVLTTPSQKTPRVETTLRQETASSLLWLLFSIDHLVERTVSHALNPRM